MVTFHCRALKLSFGCRFCFTGLETGAEVPWLEGPRGVPHRRSSGQRQGCISIATKSNWRNKARIVDIQIQNGTDASKLKFVFSAMNVFPGFF